MAELEAERRGLIPYLEHFYRVPLTSDQRSRMEACCSLEELQKLLLSRWPTAYVFIALDQSERANLRCT